MAGAIAGSSLARHLASCNKATRDKALRLLKTWLPSQTQIPEEELKKIWKGLFYCVWHADKQPVQIELINRLSSLLVSLDIPLSVHYFDVFLLTMRREWSGIDFLRLDKFYLLIRKFLHHMFVVLKKSSWDLELSTRFMCVLEEKALLCGDKYPAQGVNNHISEVFLEELKPFLPIRLEVVEILLKPFLSVMQKASDKVLVHKIKSSLFDCLLNHGKKLLEIKKVGDGGDSSAAELVEVFGTIALTCGLSVNFFDLGSSSECVQGNRKTLFNLHESFVKLEKDLASAGIEISAPHFNEDSNEDEVPDLVPISDMEVVATEAFEEVQVGVEVAPNGSVDKPSRKSKKAKKASRKQCKKEKNISSDSSLLEIKDKSEDENTPNGGSLANGGGMITFSDSVISNLHIQFEKIAAEAAMNGDSSSDSPITPVNGTASKKRKRFKNIDGKASLSADLIDQDIAVGIAIGKSGEKSDKKVRFSMKSNLVWKPHSPLPPQSLRLPPSATPRGSALKKGIPPGPVRETPVNKKMKPKGKKTRKGLKSVSPAIKRLRKLRSMSV